ncbi:uncharacterized protein LOC121871350 [Homarus americanus]|uniref:uncharacterized protein LOC121871350 n=1 Tax=Homarus americanus TaxID=6706 RepID=UPI001C4521C7|nr:uncharacterized protein LOC121871350 [Homarus americanus]
MSVLVDSVPRPLSLKMAEDVTFHLSLVPLSIDTQYFSPSHIIDWMTKFQWWEWLIILKVGFIFWVLNITIILPSIYMQVMLYTDEMTSRQTLEPTAMLEELRHIVTWALTKYSLLQKTMAHGPAPVRGPHFE